MWRWYCGQLSRRPFLTRCATTSCTMMIADIISQHIEIHAEKNIFRHRNDPEFIDSHYLDHTAYIMPTWVPREYLLDLDWKRTVRFGLSGALLNGPCGFKWMMLMEKIFGTHKSVRVIIGKIAADALIYSPFIIAMFFSFQGVLERKTLFEIVEKIENKFKHAILLSWSIWPLANLVGLLAIPFKYRMLFNNILSVGWNTYMSQYNCSTIEQMDLNSEQLHESSELGQKIKGESIQCYCLRCRSTVF